MHSFNTLPGPNVSNINFDIFFQKVLPDIFIEVSDLKYTFLYRYLNIFIEIKNYGTKYILLGARYCNRS